jgi:hypothetical protein
VAAFADGRSDFQTKRNRSSVMKRIVPALTAAAMMTALLPGSAHAWVQAGHLDCRSAGGATFVVGAVVNYRCMFFPAYGGRPHRYYATMRRLGVDVGFNNGVGLGWSVLASTRYIGRGDLAGGYGGVQANASLGVGAGANALIGGSNNSFTLQPFSGQAQSGVNASAGVAALTLVPAR